MTLDTRRRGADLEDAIFDATLGELAARGLDGLTFELIAAAAGAGKASLYRRWESPEQLVLAALARSEDRAEAGNTPSGTRLEPTGDLRDELIAFLSDLADGLATPVGRILTPLLLERERHPLLWERVVALMVEPRQRLVAESVHRAVERGAIDATAVTPSRLRAGAALVLAQHLTSGPVSREAVVEIIDEVVLPALYSSSKHG